MTRRPATSFWPIVQHSAALRGPEHLCLSSLTSLRDAACTRLSVAVGANVTLLLKISLFFNARRTPGIVVKFGSIAFQPQRPRSRTEITILSICRIQLLSSIRHLKIVKRVGDVHHLSIPFRRLNLRSSSSVQRFSIKSISGTVPIVHYLAVVVFKFANPSRPPLSSLHTQKALQLKDLRRDIVQRSPTTHGRLQKRKASHTRALMTGLLLQARP